MQQLSGEDLAEMEVLFVAAVERGWIRFEKTRHPTETHLQLTSLKVHIWGMWFTLITAFEETTTPTNGV